MKNFRTLSKAEMKKIKGGFDCSLVTCPAGLWCNADVQMCVAGEFIADGTPGGNNGNPCPAYCEPTGAMIWCVGHTGGLTHMLQGNCNTHPPTEVVGLHNVCIATNGNFWC